jgi:hypothetical protein
MTPFFRRNRWPLLLLLLGLCFLALNGWAVQGALRGVSSVADRGDAGEAAGALGWRLDIEVNRGRLEARLRDREGTPVSGLRGELRFAPPAARPAIALREDAAGLYQAPLPAGLRGEVAALLVLQRGDAGLRRQLLLQL